MTQPPDDSNEHGRVEEPEPGQHPGGDHLGKDKGYPGAWQSPGSRQGPGGSWQGQQGQQGPWKKKQGGQGHREGWRGYPGQTPYGAPGYGPPGFGNEPWAASPPGRESGMLADVGYRLLARILDTLIVFAVALPVTALAGGIQFYATSGTGSAPLDTFDGGSLVNGVFVFGLFFLYDGIQHALWGQTVGKRAAGVRVVSQRTGARPDAGSAVIRAAVYCLPGIVLCLGPIFWILNSLWCTWDRPYRQCLHDKTARTVVIKG